MFFLAPLILLKGDQLNIIPHAKSKGVLSSIEKSLDLEEVGEGIFSIK